MKFKTRFRARYCETDAAEVIYYGSFLHYFEVGKMEMFRELDIPYQRDIPIVETHCKYPAPTFFDDLLEVHSWFDDIKDKSFKIMSEVYRIEEDGTQTLVGEGYTTHVYVNDEGRPDRLPEYYWKVFETILEK